MTELNNRLQSYLQHRKEDGLYRQLSLDSGKVDFSSNDYLGFSKSAFIAQQVAHDIESNGTQKAAATGSRLLNGNSVLAENLEELLASVHHAESALLFNSGFDANVGLISTVIRPGDIVLFDESVHASIRQGIKLSGAESLTFKHNNLSDLEIKLLQANTYKVKWVITESVFSMEGDSVDLQGLSDICTKNGAELIVDEAHATGVFGEYGSGLCSSAGIEGKCFARVYTFGKAIASHGAVVVGSKILRDYLINFSKNFIYTTALETSNLLRIRHTYSVLKNNVNQVFKLNNLIEHFNKESIFIKNRYEVCGSGPIFGVIVPGNVSCISFAKYLQDQHFDVRAILSPTVPKGKERLRIILHSFNTFVEIDRLLTAISMYH